MRVAGRLSVSILNDDGYHLNNNTVL